MKGCNDNNDLEPRTLRVVHTDEIGENNGGFGFCRSFSSYLALDLMQIGTEGIVDKLGKFFTSLLQGWRLLRPFRVLYSIMYSASRLSLPTGVGEWLVLARVKGKAPIKISGLLVKKDFMCPSFSSQSSLHPFSSLCLDRRKGRRSETQFVLNETGDIRLNQPDDLQSLLD